MAPRTAADEPTRRAVPASARSRLRRLRLGARRSSAAGLDASRRNASEQEAQLGDPGCVGSEPAEEAHLDALEVRQRPIREIVGATGRQRALVHGGGEQLARPPGEAQPAIELEESALLDLGHSAPPPVPSRASVPQRERRLPHVDCPARCKGRMSVRPMVPPSASRFGGSRLRYAPPVVRSRPLLTAELLSIGSELIVGETRDTNAGDLARSLTGLGIAVTPDPGAAR